MDSKQLEIIRTLMKAHAKSMVQLTYRRIGDWHLAEDLVQETFLTACCKAEQVCNHTNAVGWLYTTLNNLTLRERKRMYHQAELPLDESITDCMEIELPLECYLPNGLRKEEKDMILLRIEKGHSFAEIAECFGITEDACRQRLSRVLRKCRSLMGE